MLPSRRFAYHPLIIPFAFFAVLSSLFLFAGLSEAKDQTATNAGPLAWGTNGAFDTSFLSGHQLNIDPLNGIHIMWQYNDNNNFNDGINFKYRSPQGIWSSVEKIDDDNGQNIEFATLAVDGQGNTHVIWIEDRDLSPHVVGYEIMYNKRTPTGGWGTPQIISTEGDSIRIGVGLSFAANQRGDLIASWITMYEEWPNFYNYALITRFKPVGGSWGGYEVANLPFANENSLAPLVKLDNNGNSYLMWLISSSSSDRGIYFNTRPYNGSWDNATKVMINNTPPWYSTYQMDVTDAGQVYAVFPWGQPGSIWYIWATRPINGNWQQIGPLPGLGCTPTSLTLNDQLEGLLAAHCGSGGTGQIYYSYKPANGNWSAWATLSHLTNDYQTAADLAWDTHGYAYAIWWAQITSDSYQQIFATTFPALSTATKDVSSSVAIPGSTSRYTITLENPLPFSLPFTVSDVLPVGTTYLPGSVAITTGSVSTSNTQINWSGSVPVNGSSRASFSVLVDGTITQTVALINQATVTVPNYDPKLLEAVMFVEPWQIFMPLTGK